MECLSCDLRISGDAIPRVGKLRAEAGTGIVVFQHDPTVIADFADCLCGGKEVGFAHSQIDAALNTADAVLDMNLRDFSRPNRADVVWDMDSGVCYGVLRVVIDAKVRGIYPIDQAAQLGCRKKCSPA